MSGMSPSSVLFSSDGYELAVVGGGAFIPGQRALLTSGLSTTNGRTLFDQSTEDGVKGAAQLTNRKALQIAATVTTSGSTQTSTLLNGAQEVVLVVNVGTVTGSGSIQYTIQEVDPGDSTTLFGPTSSTAVINNGNTPGVFTAKLSVTSAVDIKVTWTVTGTFSATIYSTVLTKTTPSSQTINGSITATNNSVGTDGGAAIGFDTQVGGKVTTTAPTYTNGNLNALSLTTLGGLRIDGVYSGGTATGTATDQMVAGGYVTTAAPTYTTATLNALSLTTAGALRVDGSGSTQPVSGTITANQGTSPWVTSVTGTVAVTQSTSPWIVAGGGTAGTPATGVVTIQGISGMTPIQVTTNKATSSNVTSVSVTANANNSLLASSATRQFAAIYNGTNKTLYIKCGATASTSSYTTQLFTGSYWEIPVDWTGAVDAFAPSGSSGSILVTELTP